MAKTFKETSEEIGFEKPIMKIGLSRGIIFSKDDIRRFNLEDKDIIRLDDAKILKNAREE